MAIKRELRVDAGRLSAVIGTAKLIRKLTWPEAKAQGEREAKKEIRRAIAKPLRSLLKAFPGAWCCALHEKEPIRRDGCSFCERRAAIRAIDKATRAPRKGSR